jgi:hypothetical protein
MQIQVEEENQDYMVPPMFGDVSEPPTASPTYESNSPNQTLLLCMILLLMGDIMKILLMMNMNIYPLKPLL